MFRLSLPELVIMAGIVFFLCGARFVPGMASSKEGSGLTFNKPFFVGLGAVVAVFVLFELFLSLD